MNNHTIHKDLGSPYGPGYTLLSTLGRGISAAIPAAAGAHRPFHKALFIGIVMLAGTQAYAQKEGSVESAEITVEKDRRVNLPEVTKPKEKPSAVKTESDAAKQVVFDIADRNVNVPGPKFNLQAQNFQPQDTTIVAYENFVRLGAGNFGRLYAEGLVSSPASNYGQATLNFKHNTAPRGPKLGELSGNSQSQIGLGGKYVTDFFKLDGQLGYQRSDLRFYGFKEQPNKEVPLADIRQTFNKVFMNIGF